MNSEMKIETRQLNPELWNDLEKLFGAKGACGGCWCMSWRVQKGEKWSDIKGTEAKRRFKKLVISGKAHGILAYVNTMSITLSKSRRRALTKDSKMGIGAGNAPLAMPMESIRFKPSASLKESMNS